MNRILTDNLPENDMVASAFMLYSLPRIYKKVDAVTVFPGLGENKRIEAAIKIWQDSAVNARHFLFPGINLKEKTAEEFSLERLSGSDMGLVRKDGVIIRLHADHTKDQAEWVRDRVVELKIKSLALCVPAFHGLRAYLTLLKSFLAANVQIPITPVFAEIAPGEKVPEVQADAWSLVPGEIKRIFDYQAKGDVATFQELKDYLNWLWKQDF